MLIKLSPEHILEYWDALSGSIAAGLAPTVFGSKEQIEFCKTALMQDKMQLWSLVEDEKPVAVVLTKFTGEYGVEVKNLLIYALVSLKPTPIKNETWMSGYETLRSFAKKHECHKILGYTNVPAIIVTVAKLGGNTENVLISLEV